MIHDANQGRVSGSTPDTRVIQKRPTRHRTVRRAAARECKRSIRMKIFVIFLTIILGLTGCTTSIDRLLSDFSMEPIALPVEVWIGTISKVNRPEFSANSIRISPAELITPEEELSDIARQVLERRERIPGKKNKFGWMRVYFSKSKEFPENQIPAVGERWELTCRTGKACDKWLVSGKKLEEIEQNGPAPDGA